MSDQPAPEAPPSGPRVQRREVWVDLPPNEYPGLKMRIWVNAPQRLWNAVLTVDSDEGAAREALKQIVLEHNGWQDFDGQPYAPAQTKEFWDEIPTELAGVILAACTVEMTKLPNSLAPKRRKSKQS